MKVNQWFKNLWQKYERHFSSAVFVLGFIWDNLTLRRVDLWLDNVIILVYIFISAGCILLLNTYNKEISRQKIFEKFFGFLPFALQFAFGGLFSAFIVFYSRSASIFSSWPFLLFLVFLFIGNEVFKEKYNRFAFQIGIFFVALFSYAIFAVPVVIGKMGDWVFVSSGIISLVLSALFLALLCRLSAGIQRGRRWIYLIFGTIFIVFNFFYFTNIIPPIPLSLKDGGIYHSVKRTSAGYSVSYEAPPFYLFFKDYNPRFHWKPGTQIYAYSAVFAPTTLDTFILHRWSYYNEVRREWIITDRLRFMVTGGRDGGYRGYTFKSNVLPGKWRVDVITGRGQVLGRMSFEVVEGEALEIERKVK